MDKSWKNKKKPKKIENDETVNYYKRIEDVLQQTESSDGHSVSNADFLDNVFSQLCEEAMVVCQRSETSPIIEQLVIKGSAVNLYKLLSVFAEDWTKVCEDRCSSHVLQKILLVVPKFISKKILHYDFDTDSDDQNIKSEEEVEEVDSSLIKLIIKLYDYLATNIETSVRHTQVSHILRALLQLLGGTCVGEKVLKSRTVRNFSRNFRNEDGEEINRVKEVKFDNYQVPPHFRKLLKRIYKGIFKLENFGVYLTDTNASPVIQTLLLVLHKVDIDLCHKVIHKVIKVARIDDTPDSVNIPPVAVDSVGSFLIELIVTLSSEKLYRELFQKLFKGKIRQFATHPSANFVLQKLIRNCPDKELFGECLLELSDHLGDVMEANYFGVLVAICATCEKLQCEQQQFIQVMMKALKCEEDDRLIKFVHLVASLMPYDMFMKTNEQKLKKMNYHGSLLLQSMLRFTNISCIETSMESLEPVELLSLSCDPCGSHVIDAAFQSEALKDKTKNIILQKLKEHFVTIACDRNGSRTIESIWKCISLKQKTEIATCLCKQEDKIRSDRFGFHVHRNLALFHFSKRRNDWTHIQQNNMKKRKIFEDIFGKDEPTKKKKKKKKSKKQVSE